MTDTTVTDPTGRSLTIRRMGALERLRLFKAAGPANAQNPMWLGMAILAASVSDIDGVPVPLPTNESQVESLVSRLGDDGINAVAAVLNPEADTLDLAAAKN